MSLVASAALCVHHDKLATSGEKFEHDCSAEVTAPKAPELSASASSDRYRLPHQGKAEAFYNHDVIQMVVAGLIMSNFVLNIVKMQIDPAAVKYEETFADLDDFFNILFTIELAINMYGHWFWTFVRSPWNWFDSLVVMIGILDLAKATLPPPLRFFRLLRAFRVFRLFKRIQSLNKIVVSLFHALPGMVNAFCINLLVMCIYAVLATEVFREIHDGCETSIWFPGAVSARAKCYGKDAAAAAIVDDESNNSALRGLREVEGCCTPLDVGSMPTLRRREMAGLRNELDSMAAELKDAFADFSRHVEKCT